jgi:hypothetical protein
MEPKQSAQQEVLCLGQIQIPNRGHGSSLGSMFDDTLPDSLGISVYQDHYGGYYRKNTTTHIMMLWKYKPLNQDDAH